MSKSPKGPATTEPEVKKGKYRRLTPRQWAEAETLYALGDMNQGDLASKFGCTSQTVGAHMGVKGIKFGERAAKHAKAAAESVEKASTTDATILAARIKATKEDHYKMAESLARLTWAEVVKAKADSAPMAVATNNLKALDLAASTLKKLREERYALLGLDRAEFVDEDQLPELVISELTEEMVEALRSRDDSIDGIPNDVVQLGVDDLSELDEEE